MTLELFWYNLQPYLPYLVICLFLVALYFLERSAFEKIALAAFLQVEKELATAEGQEKFSVAVIAIVNTMPAFLKGVVNVLAVVTGKNMHDMTHLLAQKVYEGFKSLHP